jgi:membrane-associated phospholipid phosphatase
VNRKTVFYWSLAILIAAIAIVAAFYFDEPARQFISGHQNRSLRKVMQNVSRFGDWPEHVGLGSILAGVAWWRGNKKWTRIFLAMLIALAIAGVTGRMIKISTGRARPSVKTEEVWNGPRFSSKYHAFPSGHVAASSAFFGVLLFVRRRIGFACVPIPILIGFSRMYVAAHYLSDVVCAAVLGLICAWLVWRFFLRRTPITDH